MEGIDGETLTGMMSLWWAGSVLLMLVTAYLLWRLTGGGKRRAPDDPIAILKARYARGEVDREEYERTLADLSR